MERKKSEKGTYITIINTSLKNEKNTSLLSNQKNPTLSSKKNINVIESYSILHNKKLKQIKLPLIKSAPKNINSFLFDKSSKLLKKIEKKNLLDKFNKINRNIDNITSKNKNNKKNKYLQKYFNSHSFDKLIQRQKSNKSNRSYSLENKNEINRLHVAKSAITIKKLHINNLVFNQKKRKIRGRNISPKKSGNILENSSSARSQHIYSPKEFQKRLLNNIESFKKKEKQLEKSKQQLYAYSLKQFSSRLLRKNDKNENIKNNLNDNKNKRHERTKLKTFIFNNKAIHYLDTLDLKKIPTYLPPIKLGCRYSIPEKSLEVIKREELNEAINKLINENDKMRKKYELNLTKKEILYKIRNRNLKYCDQRIHKTQENVSNTKNEIIKNYNDLKLSLNQLDNWNSPENFDNLFG